MEFIDIMLLCIYAPFALAVLLVLGCLSSVVPTSYLISSPTGLGGVRNHKKT